MKRFSAICLLVGVLAIANATSASAETLFESGTLGPTGITFADLVNGTVPGTNVSKFVFTGARFELTQPVVTSQVGGHFVQETSGTFFGAIVALDGANDFPDSGDLSSPDVLGTTALTYPNPSAEVFSNLALALDPGWYALVFGSGHFGTAGSGGAIRNGSDIGDPFYIAFQPQSGVEWVNITTFPNHRFVVQGRVVPEPSAVRLIGLLCFSFLLKRASRRV